MNKSDVVINGLMHRKICAVDLLEDPFIPWRDSLIKDHASYHTLTLSATFPTGVKVNGDYADSDLADTYIYKFKEDGSIEWEPK